MHTSVPHYDDDDDDVPPGFEGRRLQRPGAKQFSAFPAGAPDCSFPADHMHKPQQGPAMTAYQQTYHQPQQQQRWQQQPPPPPPAHANGFACSASPQPLSRHGSDAGAATALGGARQFQRALSGSVSAVLQQQQQSQLAQQPHSPTHRHQDHRLQAMSPACSTPASLNASTPDYGEHGDSDTEYGAPSSSSTRKARGTRNRPTANSSRNPAGAGGAGSPGYPQQQQQQRSLSSSPTPAGHHISSSPTRPGLAAAGGASSGRGPKSAGHQVLPEPAAGAANQLGASVRPAAAAAATGGSSSTPGSKAHGTAFPQPDYGKFDDGKEYGQEAKGRRRRGARSGSSSRPGSGSRGPEGHPDPEAAAAAAAQALAGITSPAPKAVRKARPAHQGAPRPQRTPLSAERTSQLEAELAALRSRLVEAEAREVEAHMAVINLSSDNTSLQAQLSGMRQQKQQLEQMLLFGSDPQDSEEYMDDYSSTPSAQSEGSRGGTSEAEALAHGAGQQQQQQEADGEELLPVGTQASPVTTDAGTGAASEQVVTSGGGVSPPRKQSVPGVATEPALGAGAPEVSSSLSEEIAAALAAAEAAGEAAVTAGK